MKRRLIEKIAVPVPKHKNKKIAGKVQIEKDEIAIARGRHPKVRLKTGAVGGLIQEDEDRNIICARVFWAEKDGTYFLDSGEIRRKE